MNSTPLLTSEVAQLLNISEGTVRLWERLGKLHAVRTGRGTRIFDRDEVLRCAEVRAAARGTELVVDRVAIS